MSPIQPASPFEPPRALGQHDGVDPSAMPTAAAWSPKAIGWISFFFTFLPAGIMLALNYERLGQPEKKVPTLLAVFGGFAAFCAAIFFVPDNPLTDRLFSIVNVALAVSFYRLQKGAFEMHQQKGGTKARVLVPVLLSLAWVVFLGALVVGAAMIGANETGEVGGPVGIQPAAN